MKSFKFGNLAVLSLSVLVLLIMITYTFGAAARSSSSLTREEKRELRQQQRAGLEADDVEYDVDASDEDRGNKRKGGKRKGGKRRGGNKRKRDGIGKETVRDHMASNYTMDCECGKKMNMRIIGGSPTGRNTYSWQGALIDKAGKLVCGASLINNLYVLTAASCLVNFTNPSNITVRLRDYNLNKPDQVNELNKAVAEIIMHKGYESPAHKDDIALLKLGSKVVFPGTPAMAPVCLPSSKDMLYEREKAIATGWGFVSEAGPMSNKLKEVTLKIETNEDCQAAGFPKKEIKKTMICAGKKKKKGICNGDEGGPLVYETHDGKYEQIGISSFTLAGCGQMEKEPSVFTRVNKYLRWIQRKTKDAVYCSGSTFPGDVPPAGGPHDPPPGGPHDPPPGGPHDPPADGPHVPPANASHVPPADASHVPPADAPHDPPADAPHMLSSIVAGTPW